MSSSVSEKFLPSSHGKDALKKCVDCERRPYGYIVAALRPRANKHNQSCKEATKIHSSAVQIVVQHCCHIQTNGYAGKHMIFISSAEKQTPGISVSLCKGNKVPGCTNLPPGVPRCRSARAPSGRRWSSR